VTSVGFTCEDHLISPDDVVRGARARR